MVAGGATGTRHTRFLRRLRRRTAEGHGQCWFVRVYTQSLLCAVESDTRPGVL